MRAKCLLFVCVLVVLFWAGLNLVHYEQKTASHNQPYKPIKSRVVPVETWANRQTHDEFSEFADLSPKVLHTPAEQERFRRSLSDSRLIRQAYLELANPNTEHEIRFKRLDYFERAIAWTGNPAREEAIDAVRNVILLDNLGQVSDIKRRKSIAGDKIEAYAILKRFVPQELEIIKALPKEGRIQKLLAYAENITRE